MEYIYKIALIFTFFFLNCSCIPNTSLCSIFDAFRIQPDNIKYEIGGAFPLHGKDCTELEASTVQDIVAIQWALTYWNQNSNNSQAKIGLYAGDSCSRVKEALFQTTRFLDSLGYLGPEECISETKRRRLSPILLGLLSPKDYESANAVASSIKSLSIPVVTYSTSSAQAFINNGINNFITTAPTLSVFIEVFLKLMKILKSDLVCIVDDGTQIQSISRLVHQIKSKKVFVSEIVSLDDPNFFDIISYSDSQIILSLINKHQLIDLLTKANALRRDKLWIAILPDSDRLSPQEQSNIVMNGIKIQAIILQQKQKEFFQFGEYFQRVIKDKYQSYFLLTAYVQKVHNCTTSRFENKIDCSKLDLNMIKSKYEQATSVEPAIRAAYGFAAVGAKLSNSKDKKICEKLSSECTKRILFELESLIYEFNSEDVEDLNEERLRFYRLNESILISSGIIIEGIELINDDFYGPIIAKSIEYETGRQSRFVNNNLRVRKIRSICPPYRSFCGKCHYTVQAKPNRYFLLTPKEYPVYLMGLFDFREGHSCELIGNFDISIPMAFYYTVSTFQQKYGENDLLRNLDLGVIFADSCTVARRAVETILLGENHCFSFQQAERNITLVPGSIFGHLSAVNDVANNAIEELFTLGENVLLSFNSDRSNSIDKFTTMPSNKHQAIALVKILKKFHWEYVTVVLSEQDMTSKAAFRHFEEMATNRGICIAAVVRIIGSNIPNTVSPSATNVTLFFATALDTANFFAARFRRDSYQSRIHIVLGNGHDFYLADPSNIASFVGTLSIQPKDKIRDDFRQWIESITPLTFPEPWYWDYVENQWQCALSAANRQRYGGNMCTGVELLDIPSLGRMTRSGYLSVMLEKYLFAVDSVYKKLCPEQKGICNEFYIKGKKQILNALRKTQVEDAFDIYEFLPDIGGTFSYKNIGNWSFKNGLQFSENYQYFDFLANLHSSNKILSKTVVSLCVPPSCECRSSYKKRTEVLSDDSPSISGSYIRSQPANSVTNRDYVSLSADLGYSNRRVWNYVLLTLITITLITAISIVVLVCVKMYLRVVKGNQSLGISLLIGVIILNISAYLFIMDPSDVICRLRMVFHSIGYTVCFGVMIAKATQLKNAETLGFSTIGYISYWNYWLLLLFVIGVQIALSLRWLAQQYVLNIVLNGPQYHPVCAYSDLEFLTSQAYVVILLALSFFINSRNRNIKRNYEETKWLFLASLTCIFIWLAWMIAYNFAPVLFKDSIVVIELILCSIILLGFLFGPKLYILMSYETVVVDCETNTINGKGTLYENDLFEPVTNQDSKRNISPVSSIYNYSVGTPSPATNRPRSDDQGPVFQTVVRKKTKRRSSSEYAPRIQPLFDQQLSSATLEIKVKSHKAPDSLRPTIKYDEC